MKKKNCSRIFKKIRYHFQESLWQHHFDESIYRKEKLLDANAMHKWNNK